MWKKQVADLTMNVIMTELSCVSFYWLKVIDAVLHREAIRHCDRKYSTAWLAQTQTQPQVTITSVAGTKLDYVFPLCSSCTEFVYNTKVNHNDTARYHRPQRKCHYLSQRNEHFLELLMFGTTLYVLSSVIDINV